MPQLSIEIPGPAGHMVGVGIAMFYVAIAIRLVWPVLNDKASRRVARMHRAKAARKK